VEHIERVVCPTITSVDFAGGEPFRFRHDRRSIVMLIGEDGYRTWEDVAQFAKMELEPAGFQVSVIHSAADNPNHFPGLVPAPVAGRSAAGKRAAADAAPSRIGRDPAHIAAGKPVVGIRTASHAFVAATNLRPKATMRGSTSTREYWAATTSAITAPDRRQRWPLRPVRPPIRSSRASISRN
jgi:hypothetical protein